MYSTRWKPDLVRNITTIIGIVVVVNVHSVQVVVCGQCA